jgi:hypothetical protein
MKAAHLEIYWQEVFELSFISVFVCSVYVIVMKFKLPQSGVSSWNSLTYVLQCGNRIHSTLIFWGIMYALLNFLNFQV